MARNVDCYCENCKLYREMICDADENPLCPTCATPMQQHWWTRRRAERTVWSDAEAVVVFKKPDGTYSFPARSDKPTPEGYERIVARSDREIAKIEREAGVRHERRWYNSGNGPEDEVASPSRSMR